MKDPFVIQENGRSPRDSKIPGFHERRWEGEWMDDTDQQPSPLGRIISQKRLIIFLIVVIVGIVVLTGQTFRLQIIQGSIFRDIAEGNRIRIQTIKADRGIIYDCNLKPLVKNIPDFSLQITPADIPEEKKEEIIGQLAELTKGSVDDILALVTEGIKLNPYQPVIVKEHIDYEQALLLEIETAGLPGVILIREATRDYLEPEANLAHVLGYISRVTPEELVRDQYLPTDYIGRTGLEATYEKILAGEDGKKRVEVDILGKEKKIVGSRLSRPGKNLILALNLELQKRLAQALERNTRAVGAHKGAAVALDPTNGEVLALVSFPGYNNNLFSQGMTASQFQEISDNPYQPLFSRIIQGQYPSGSTIKPVIAATALEEGIIAPRTTINSTGGINIENKWFYPDWKAGGHGLCDVVKAIAESVNTFFYYVGGGYKDFKGLGVELITKYARLFGLGQKLGIDLPGEVGGFLPSSEWKEEAKGERWYIGDTYHLAIGQGDILVTPLQVASFTATIANGGKLFKPHLVREIQAPDGTGTHQIEPEIISENFIKLEHLEIVRRGLREAVKTGGAKRLASLSVAVAGKTGTAQIGGDQRTHAWFTCFAPYENPEIVITVLIENGGEGHKAALPVAKEVLEWYFSQ